MFNFIVCKFIFIIAYLLKKLNYTVVMHNILYVYVSYKTMINSICSDINLSYMVVLVD